MNMSMQLAVAVAAVTCLCLVAGAPDARLTRTKQRPTRGFKNVEMMTARGFGKRDMPHTRSERDVENQATASRAQRGIPTFKSPTVGIARDFGKRTPEFDTEEQNIEVHPRRKFNPKNSLMVAYDFGKRSGNDDNTISDEGYGLDNFWEVLEAASEREGQEATDEKALESIPLDWFVNEMLNNPDFARSLVRKFVDLNQDGMLSSDELLRNVV